MANAPYTQIFVPCPMGCGRRTQHNGARCWYCERREVAAWSAPDPRCVSCGARLRTNGGSPICRKCWVGECQRASRRARGLPEYGHLRSVAPIGIPWDDRLREYLVSTSRE